MIKIVKKGKGFGAKSNERVSRKQMVSESLIKNWKDVTKENQDEVDWEEVSTNKKLSEDFIREFQDKVDWYWISAYQNLSEDFIREFQDKVDWHVVSNNQVLSEDFIREFKDRVEWWGIAKRQKLSEDFIREFQDVLNWERILRYQKISDDFRKEIEDNMKYGFNVQIGRKHGLIANKPLAAKSNERNERIARLKKIIARGQDEKTALVRNSKKDETADKKKMQCTEKIAPKKNMSLKERLEIHRRATKKISERKSAIRFGRRYEADVETGLEKAEDDSSMVDLVDLWLELFDVANGKKAIKEVEKLLQELGESADDVLDWIVDEEIMSIIKGAVEQSIIANNVEFAKSLKDGEVLIYHGKYDSELGGEIIDWDPSNLSEDMRQLLFNWKAFARDMIVGGDVSTVWIDEDSNEVSSKTEGAEKWLVWSNDDDLENARIIKASDSREEDSEKLGRYLRMNWTFDMIDEETLNRYFDYLTLWRDFLSSDGYHKVSYDTVIYLP